MNRPDIGLEFGKKFGQALLTSPHYSMPDYVIPIPLHYKRQQQRGYNQSAMFAQGISEVIGAQVLRQSLVKTKEINSQTKKSRSDRFTNVLDSFSLRKAEKLYGKKVLIVDDVLTTGATMEAAYQHLYNIPGIRIQLGLIALANG